MGRSLTLCYVQGQEAELERVVGREIVLYGRQRRLTGVRHPLCVVQKIAVPDPTPASR
jgi:hypothetical protein